jgi:hypothetical protein
MEHYKTMALLKKHGSGTFTFIRVDRKQAIGLSPNTSGWIFLNTILWLLDVVKH